MTRRYVDFWEIFKHDSPKWQHRDNKKSVFYRQIFVILDIASTRLGV
jgi:hypothetical protein